MARFINPTLAILTVLVFTSCEKVIDLEVDNAPPRIVVEGNVFNGPGPFSVNLTRSASFYDSAPPVSVTGANVRIADDMGNSVVLTEGPNGTYTAQGITGVEGHTYSLELSAEGETYTASNTMPGLTLIDSLTYEYLDSTDYAFLDMEDFGYYITAYHSDPVGVENFYQFRLYLHGELHEPTITKNTFSDRLFDGLQNRELLFAHSFQLGDTVTVELWNIDRSAYEFYTTLNEVSDNNGGGPFSGIPDNPDGNLSNGAFGFFGSVAIDPKEIVIE
jgi:hypothetical protein